MGRTGWLALWTAGVLLVAPAAGRAQSSGEPVAAIRADSIAFTSAGVTLRGMLRLPAIPDARSDAAARRPPFPAVLLLPGGGTRYLTNEPDYWADRLAEAGIAALVVHKRGTGDSGGDWASSTFEDFIADAGAALETLRARHDVDPDRLAVMGFSQGGRLAPIVASRFGLAAAVGISGPQVPPGETRLYALGNAFRAAGMPPENLAIAMELWRDHAARVAAGRDLAPLDARIREAAARMSTQALPPTSDAFAPSPIFNSLEFDAGPDLARLRAPFLAMYGADDRVVPVAASVRALHAAFAASGYDGLNLLVVPGVGHGLSVDSRTRHPLYEDVPVAWLAAQLGVDTSGRE
jgi:dienelactone hydrolase